MYITYDDYISMGGTLLDEECAKKYIELASFDIDNLTFNRINKIGFDNLTEFQKLVIKKSVMLQTDFRADNEDWLNSAISQYSINGVNINYGNSKTISVINGVFIPTNIFSILKQTGLCSLNLR